MEDYRSFNAVRQDLEQKKITCVDLVQHYVLKINATKDLNAFIEVFEESAKEKAQKVDLKIKNGTAGKLAGLILSIKDNICYKGHGVSAASKILENFESIYNATVVERLLEEDAIIIGRTNCDEFAMGSSNENSFYGAVKHPFIEGKVPGGSSGGAAASVAAGLCMAALGSDTGGSVRQPASFCGLVGFKPTYGRISRYGLIAYASSFDSIGCFTNTIEDTALILEVIAGKDDFDSTLSIKEVTNYSKKIVSNSSAKMTLAVFKNYIENPALDPEVKKRILSIITDLESEGHTIKIINFDWINQMIPVYYALTTAEASTNLSRYDGVHFGYRSQNAIDLESTYVKSRSEGFGAEVKRRILLGTHILSEDNYENYYLKAQKVRRLIRDDTKKILKDCDFIIHSTTPHAAFDRNAMHKDPIQMYLEDIYTVHANIVGLPAISLPLGKTEKNHPFGIQLMTDSFKEEKLLSFSNYLMENFGCE